MSVFYYNFSVPQGLNLLYPLMEPWGGHFSCAPEFLEMQVSLVKGQCSGPYLSRFFRFRFLKLVDSECLPPPSPLVNLQFDRGVIGQPGSDQLFPCDNFDRGIENFGSFRFQSRQVLTGVCNPRLGVAPPGCSFQAGLTPFRQNCVNGNDFSTGRCFGLCNRFDFNSFSIEVAPSGDINLFYGDSCSGDNNILPQLTFLSVPVSPNMADTFCRGVMGAPFGIIARHGIRAYSPQPYITVLSATPTPSTSPSITGTPSSSPSTTGTVSPTTSPTSTRSQSQTPSNMAVEEAAAAKAAAAKSAAIASTDNAALIGVSVIAGILAILLTGTLVQLFQMKRAMPLPPPPPVSKVTEWGRAVELVKPSTPPAAPPDTTVPHQDVARLNPLSTL